MPEVMEQAAAAPEVSQPTPQAEVSQATLRHAFQYHAEQHEAEKNAPPPPTTAPATEQVRLNRQTIEDQFMNAARDAVAEQFGLVRSPESDPAAAPPAQEPPANAAASLQEALSAPQTTQQPSTPAQPVQQAPVPSADVVVANLFHSDPDARAYYRGIAAKHYPHLAVAPTPQAPPPAPDPNVRLNELVTKAAHTLFAKLAKPEAVFNEEKGKAELVTPKLDADWVNQHATEIEAEVRTLDLLDRQEALERQIKAQSETQAQSYVTNLQTSIVDSAQKIVAGRKIYDGGKEVGSTAALFNGPDGKPIPTVVRIYNETVQQLFNDPQWVAAHQNIGTTTPPHLRQQAVGQWKDSLLMAALRATQANPEVQYLHSALKPLASVSGQQGAQPATARPGGNALPPARAATVPTNLFGGQNNTANNAAASATPADPTQSMLSEWDKLPAGAKTGDALTKMFAAAMGQAGAT